MAQELTLSITADVESCYTSTPADEMRKALEAVGLFSEQNLYRAMSGRTRIERLRESGRDYPQYETVMCYNHNEIFGDWAEADDLFGRAEDGGVIAVYDGGMMERAPDDVFTYRFLSDAPAALKAIIGVMFEG